MAADRSHFLRAHWLCFLYIVYIRAPTVRTRWVGALSWSQQRVFKVGFDALSRPSHHAPWAAWDMELKVRVRARGLAWASPKRRRRRRTWLLAHRVYIRRRHCASAAAGPPRVLCTCARARSLLSLSRCTTVQRAYPSSWPPHRICLCCGRLLLRTRPQTTCTKVSSSGRAYSVWRWDVAASVMCVMCGCIGSALELAEQRGVCIEIASGMYSISRNRRAMGENARELFVCVAHKCARKAWRFSLRLCAKDVEIVSEWVVLW